MSKDNPFEDMPKSKLINRDWYRLHNQCFNKITEAKTEASELRKDGYAVRQYKKGKYYFLYIRKK